MTTSKDNQFLNENVDRKKIYYREIMEMLENNDNQEKRELLYRILSIIKILPTYECQRILDYLSELYFS